MHKLINNTQALLGWSLVTSNTTRQISINGTILFLRSNLDGRKKWWNSTFRAQAPIHVKENHSKYTAKNRTSFTLTTSCTELNPYKSTSNFPSALSKIFHSVSSSQLPKRAQKQLHFQELFAQYVWFWVIQGPAPCKTNKDLEHCKSSESFCPSTKIQNICRKQSGNTNQITYPTSVTGTSRSNWKKGKERICPLIETKKKTVLGR